MSGATVDYLERLLAWGLGLCLIEGLILTVAWRLWSRALRRAPAGPRHRLAVAHFVGFAGLPVLSLAAMQWMLSRSAAAESAFTALVAEGPSHALAWAGPVVAAIWFGGVLISLLRLVRAMRCRRHLACDPAPADLQATVARLTRSLPLRRMPEVATANVASPQVTGLRQPRLLLPADIAERLTPGQLDAVLTHELVHVRCADYGWNLAQRVLLALVWFHPGAWIVHADLRHERELRCDALAIGRRGSGGDLAMALLRLAERHAEPVHRLALSAAAGDLTQRIEQLVHPRPAGRPWLAAAPAVAVGSFCVLAVGAGAAAHADPGLRDLYQASAFSPITLIQAQDPAGPFQLRILRGRVLAASVGSEGALARVVQNGRAVVLIDDRGAPAVAVTVTPQDRVMWRARASASAR